MWYSMPADRTPTAVPWAATRNCIRNICTGIVLVLHLYAPYPQTDTKLATAATKNGLFLAVFINFDVSDSSSNCLSNVSIFAILYFLKQLWLWDLWYPELWLTTTSKCLSSSDPRGSHDATVTNGRDTERVVCEFPRCLAHLRLTSRINSAARLTKNCYFRMTVTRFIYPLLPCTGTTKLRSRNRTRCGCVSLN